MLNMVEWALKEGFIHEGANREIKAFVMVRQKWYDYLFSFSKHDSKSISLNRADYEHEKEIACIKYGFNFDIVASLYTKYRREEFEKEREFKKVMDYIKSKEEGTPV